MKCNTKFFIPIENIPLTYENFRFKNWVAFFFRKIILFYFSYIYIYIYIYILD